MNWNDVAQMNPIYLNLGGGHYCHPLPDYLHFVAVDARATSQEWGIQHDLCTPIPLSNGSVSRILTEDFLEHLELEDIRQLLKEAWRLLKPGGHMRIGVPDYLNPKDIAYLKSGSDPRYPEHLTLTTYELMRDLINQSPFKRFKFYQYWQGDVWHDETIDYSLGMVRRTPDNDSNCRVIGFRQFLRRTAQDVKYLLRHGLRFSLNHFLARQHHRLNTTSIVVDLYKD